jgi:hypothetical protein
MNRRGVGTKSIGDPLPCYLAIFPVHFCVVAFPSPGFDKAEHVAKEREGSWSRGHGQRAGGRGKRVVGRARGTCRVSGREEGRSVPVCLQRGR